MRLSSDPKKTAQEEIFSRKKQVQTYPTIIVDEKLSFKQHIDSTILKLV